MQPETQPAQPVVMQQATDVPAVATQSIPATPPPVSISSDSGDSKKMLLFLVGGVIIIVAIIAGIYYYFTRQQPIQDTTTSSPQSQVVNQTAPVMADPIQEELNSINPGNIDEAMTEIDTDLKGL